MVDKQKIRGKPCQFAVNMKRMRNREGTKFSQAALARQAGLATSTIFSLEQGFNGSPSLHTVRAVAKVLGVTVEEIMS